MTPKTQVFYEFGDFRLELAEKVLRRADEVVPLTPKVFETLQYFVENANRLIEKEELMSEIWANRLVEDSNLTFNVKTLRRALGDDAANPTFIETVRGRGYRFIASVVKINEESSLLGDSSAAQPETSSVRKNDLTPNQSRFRRFFVPLAAAVLLIGLLGYGSWYARSSGSRAAEEAPVLFAPFSSEKISTNGKVRLAAVSPDGKNVVYSNEIGNKQSLWLRQLESGNNTELIPPSEDIYYKVEFSPDANFIYLVRRSRMTEGQATIYRASIFGGVPTKILSDVQGWSSISLDGSIISFVRCPFQDNEFCSLWVADADGQHERKLVSRPRPFRISDNRISPDGKTIAFAVGQSENQGNEFGLSEVSIKDGAERELTSEKFFNIKSLAWLPGQNGLLIAASRIPNRNFRLWLVSTNDGKATPLTKDSEDYSTLSLDRSAGIIAATQIKADFNLTLYHTEGLTEKEVLTDAITAGFAPNGKILFSSAMSGNEEIWSRNADGSELRQLTNSAADETDPLAAPDGNSIFFSSNRTGTVQIWRMSADGSNQTQITNSDGGFTTFVSPDNRWLYYQHGLERTLWRVSTAGGGNEQLVLNKSKYRFAVSPDASQVAFSEKQGAERILTIVSLGDNQIIKTFPTPISATRITEIVWASDAKSIFYVLINNALDKTALWRQPLDGSKPQQIADLGDAEILSLAVTPDSKNFAIVQGVWKHDAVLLRGLK